MTEETKPTEHMLREVHEQFSLVVVRETISLAQKEALEEFSTLTVHIMFHGCVLVEALFETTTIIGLPAYHIHGTVKGTPEHMARLLKGGGAH